MCLPQVMCELKARLSQARPFLDTQACTLTCGKGSDVVNVPDSHPYMV